LIGDQHIDDFRSAVINIAEFEIEPEPEREPVAGDNVR